MGKSNRIVIIGGVACGPKTAARARRRDPSASITLIEQDANLSVATCGLPYFVSGVIQNESALVTRSPAYFRDVFDIDVRVGCRALSIDRTAHTVLVQDLSSKDSKPVLYDRLVLATGGLPVVPNLPGKDLKGVFVVNRINDVVAIRNWIGSQGCRKAVIIGAGMISVEMVEALAAVGITVTVVEALGGVLPGILDWEMSRIVERHMRGKGVVMRFGQMVTGFLGDADGRVRKVSIGSEEIETDLVVLAIGRKPNTELAKAAGLEIGKRGGIAVNDRLQTGDPDIYAGGDCVESTHRVTGGKVLIPLGSTANKHGRVIGANITGGSESFPGIVGSAVARVFSCNVGRTGLSESQAKDAGYDYVTVLVPGTERASYYPGAKEILVKLVAEKAGGRLLGGQVVGSGDVAKRLDILAVAITSGAKADDLASSDLCYAPPFNSAMDPLHHAANVIRNKLAGDARSISPVELKKKLDAGEDFILLDVRSPLEWNTVRIDVPQARLIPLPELRRRLAELPRDKEIVTLCRASVRAYQAQKILDGAGFRDVKFVDGSISFWPYELKSDR